MAAAFVMCVSAASCSESSSSSVESSSAVNTSSQAEKTSDGSGESKADSSSQKEDEPEYENALEPDGLPVIAIETLDRSDDVMDFVTKPVAKHVSKSIASWSPGYRMPPEPYYEECTVTVTDTDGSRLISAAPADVKVRGNWTTNYEKKPLRIKFSEKQSMLGLNDEAEMKNWLLLAEYKDFSMMRNRAALEIAKSLLGEDGYYSADSRFVEVTINGEYWGVYLLTEQQQINQNRIDITEAEKDYQGSDIGYFMEFDGYYVNEDDLNQFYVTYNKNAELIPYDGEGGSGKTIQCLRGGNNDVGITIKSDIYSQEQHDFIASYVNNVYKIMYEAAYNDKAYVFNADYSDIEETTDITAREAVENVVDVQSLADSYILCEIACDADIYWSSFFMDVDFGEGGNKKLTFEAPWDFDSALGNKNRCADAQGFYAANILKDVNDQYKTINPWLAVLMYEDWYQDIIKERWTAVYDEGAFDDAIKMVTEESESITPAFDRNYDRWDNIRHNGAADELCRRAKNCKTQLEAAEYLAEWLTDRVEFLNGQWHL